MAFWEWMICSGGVAKVRSDTEFGGLSPTDARNAFKTPFSCEDGPTWTFNRYGATRTLLADGRMVCVGGEHEDFYDPDFWIYNDVVVLTPSDQIEIYGYPPEIFPPTDFHTATLVQDRLLVVGSLGYHKARAFGHTPVYVLDLLNYSFSEMRTTGEMPGWIFEHHAQLDPSGSIVICGGRIASTREGKEVHRRNFDDYSLHFTSGVWRRLTNRNWRQFNIRQDDGRPFVLDRYVPAEALLPDGGKPIGQGGEERNSVRALIDGVNVSVGVLVSCIEVIIQEDLPEEDSRRIAGKIREKAEAILHKPLIIENPSGI